MTPASPPPFPQGGGPASPLRSPQGEAPLSCAAFTALLTEVERTDGGRDPDAALAHLSSHAGTCFACRARYGARFRALEGLCALRARAVPDGLLDDFSARVLARMRGPRPLGLEAAGMSPAFLDAPQSLARWRYTAAAASVLVALGAGLFVSGRVGWRGDSPARADREDVVLLRDALLDRFDMRLPDDAPARHVQTVDFPARGSSEYWGWVSRSDRPMIRPVPPAERPAVGRRAAEPEAAGRQVADK